jgi:hypothetical protein
VILPVFYQKDETYQVFVYNDWHYIMAAMIAEVVKGRFLRRWHAK